MAAACFAVAGAQAQIINVNFYNTTGMPTPAVESTLQGMLGPAGGLGTTWNQFNVDSAGNLKASTGASTTVGFNLSGYNDRNDADASAAYEANLVDLIKDLRTEFGLPNLPISIGTTGMDITGPYSLVEQAQLNVANPALHPELGGHVFTVDTRPFWRDAAVSPSGFGYHWNHNGETHYLIGKGMGQGMTGMLATP